jgi:hypothetical protein
MAESTVQAGRSEDSKAASGTARAGGLLASVADLVRSKVMKRQETPGARARSEVKKEARTAKAAGKLVAKAAASKKPAGKKAGTERAKKGPEPKKAAELAAKKIVPATAKKGAGKSVRDKTPAIPTARPRATKLPPVGNALNKRELEQLLTAGQGRGVSGEGSLKGKLAVKDGFPYLRVIGRDKRELDFLLQGPDQEVLPAYADHKVSVSGLIRKTNNHGGTVDVRKWTAKKPEEEQVAPEPQEQKLRFLSPGEVEQLCSGGMGAGLVGFARFRGTLEMTGEDFFLVVSGAGTRQQVSFLIEGKAIKGLRKHVGHTLMVTGMVEKSSGWGGKLQLESFEVRPQETRAISRENMQVTQVEALGTEPQAVEVLMNQGLSVRLPERPGYIWAIEPTTAKRVGLREANFEPATTGTATREFFFTPRNPGVFDVDFFLAKAFSPAQTAKTCRLTVTVKTHA